MCVVETPMCTVQYEPVLWGQCWVEMELCRRHMPSASLVRAEIVQILVIAVKRKSRCRWLLEEMQPRTSNGWTNPCDSVQSPIWRLGDCKHLQEGRSYAASSQSNSREYPTVPRILRDELVVGDHS